MTDRAKEVMRSMLDGFANDPPDNDFQKGFLEALVVFAHEGLGMRMEDRAFQQASDIAYAPVVGAEQPKRRSFMVIDGGKGRADGEVK